MESLATAILAHQPQAIVAVDINGFIRVINKSFCNLFEYPIDANDYIGKPSASVFFIIKNSLLCGGENLTTVMESLSTQQAGPAQYQIELKTGKFIQIECTPCYCDEVKQGNIWSFTDISTQVLKERDLYKSQGRYQKLLYRLNEIVFTINTQNKIEFVNNAWEKILEWKFETSMGTDMMQYVAIGSKATMANGIDEVLRGIKDSIEMIVEFKTMQGHSKWMQVFLSATEYYTDIPLWGTLTDITNQQIAEQELKKTLEKEKELNEIKTNFVNMVTHEFRTPIAGILSSVELVELINKEKEHPLSDQLELYMDRIKGQLTRMTELMNNVLLLGKIGANKFQFNPSKIDLTQLCKEIVLQDFQETFASNQINIKIEGKKKSLHVDIRLIKHVIINLITNALKYSPKEVKPEVIIVYEKTCLYLKIRDYGIGIPESELEDLFSAFFRASNTDQFEGTGLGLVIVKEFVEMHKGTIQVTSCIDKGTTFTIMLPYK